MMSNFSHLEAKTYWDALRKKSVECVPVRHGHWVDDKFEDGEWHHTCSVCGMQLRHDAFDNFCGNCGAKMDEVQEDA